MWGLAATPRRGVSALFVRLVWAEHCDGGPLERPASGGAVAHPLERHPGQREVDIAQHQEVLSKGRAFAPSKGFS